VTTPQRQSGEYHRSLFEHAVVGLFRSTVEGRFVAVNPALVEMLGYASKAELLALNLPTDLYVRPEDRARLIERYGKVDRVDGVEVAWRRKDGAQHLATYGWGQPGEYVSLAVSDSSSGMAQEVQARAFDPFFTTKPVGSGTGLGLPMVYSLMKQLQGFVHLYSEVGHGTTVKLYVPPSAEAVVGERPVASLELPRGTERVMVVEDDLSIRRATVRVLRQLGYQVKEASDGAEAAAALATGGLIAELVISDLVMPKMGGRELYRRLRAEGLAIPVLIVSGYADAASRGEAELGPDVRFLHKPWTITEMAVRVRETLALGRKGGART